MKKYLTHKGSIIINSFMISIILLMMIITTLTICLNEFYIVKSNENSIKAYYLAESGIHETISKINNVLNELIEEYLIKVKEDKRTYIQKGMLQKNENPYKPLSLDQDLQNYFSSQSSLFNKTITNKEKLFSYHDPYSYTIKTTYTPQDNTIDILSTGLYRGTKKFIHVHLLLPHIENDGVDMYNLPKIKILPLKVESYYQVFGQ
jgi:hypothetical protein